MKNKILQIIAVVFIGAFTLGFFVGRDVGISLTKNKIIEEVYTVKKGDTLMDE